eukprot:3388117-Rhodomonas_salina.4
MRAHCGQARAMRDHQAASPHQGGASRMRRCPSAWSRAHERATLECAWQRPQRTTDTTLRPMRNPAVPKSNAHNS